MTYPEVFHTNAVAKPTRDSRFQLFCFQKYYCIARLKCRTYGSVIFIGYVR